MRISNMQKVQVLRRLALYLRSGIPIKKSLALMLDDSSDRAHAHILTHVLNDIDAGRTLSQSLGRFTRAYGSLELNLISIGESTGTLPASLERASELLKLRVALRQQLLSALLYPACILLGIVAISLFLVIFAFPKIIPLLIAMNTELPLPTRVMIGTSALVQEHGTAIAASICFLLVIIAFSLRGDKFRRAVQYQILRIPILGTSVRLYYVANISRLLSILLKSGVRVEAAIAQVRNGISFIPYQALLHTLEESSLHGHRLSDYMRDHPLLFPKSSIEIISAGEITGTLSDSFRTTAEVYEEYLSELTNRLSSLVEPVLMVCMGTIVGFIALAIILPMYGLTQSISLP